MFIYSDDIFVFAKTLEEHRTKVRRLMRRHESANLVLEPDKCEFLRKEVAHLGHVIGKDGVRPDPQKLGAVQKSQPRRIRKVL